MPDDPDEVIRRAYEAYGRGDLATMLELIDPDLEWTYLDPAFEHPDPQVCHGRDELATALRRQQRQGLRSELEEVIVDGDRAAVVVRTPGLDAHRAWQADDRNFDVITVRGGRIVALRACRDREEAMAVLSPA